MAGACLGGLGDGRRSGAAPLAYDWPLLFSVLERPRTVISARSCVKARSAPEVRKYPGWHHHMLSTMLAHFFLWHLKLRLGEKSSRADGVAAAEIIGRRLALAH